MDDWTFSVAVLLGIVTFGYGISLALGVV